jgi:hypothetical protein
MKWLITLFAVFSIVVPTFAQDSKPQEEPLPEMSEELKAIPEIYWVGKPIQCGTPEALIDLVKRFGELPVLTATGTTVDGNGMQRDVNIIFGANRETGSWTLIEVNSETQACVLGSGNNWSEKIIPKGIGT